MEHLSGNAAKPNMDFIRVMLIVILLLILCTIQSIMSVYAAKFFGASVAGPSGVT
jgi:hypothetical protein